jgi:hypothetical protein
MIETLNTLSMPGPFPARRGGQTLAQRVAAIIGPSDLGAFYAVHPSRLWKDTSGTDPVTADGDTVARIDDAGGKGEVLVQATPGARPVYQTDGTLHWLAIDGVDDVLFGTASDQLVAPWGFWAAVNITTGAGNGLGLFNKSGAESSVSTGADVEGIFQRSDGTNRQLRSASRIANNTSYLAALNSAFTIGTPFLARAFAETGPDQLRATTAAGTSTTAAVYTGTPGSSAFRIGHGGASAAFRFYGGFAIDRPLTAGESALVEEYLNGAAGL